MQERTSMKDIGYIEPVPKDIGLLSNLAQKFGVVLDQLVYGFGYSLADAYALILRTRYAEWWYENEGYYVCGRFAGEITKKLIELDGKKLSDGRDDYVEKWGSVYWSAWIITLLMDYTSWTLEYILTAVPPDELEDMYWTYHEMSEKKALDELVRRVKRYYTNASAETTADSPESA